VFGLVATALIALWIAPDSRTATRREIARRVRQWRPGEEDRRLPDPKLINADAEIAGQWVVRRHRSGSTMTIIETSPTEYLIHFSTWGCLGDCVFERRGQLHDGIFTLVEPVGEYLPVVYDRLYVVRIAGADLLLPGSFVTQLQNGLSADRSQVTDDHALSWCVFRRETK
jgi:hypothetical protein